MTEDSDEGRRLIRQLASCKQSLRDRALREILTKWLLAQKQEMPEDDIKKLWKGLFYCFWHADKSLYQSQLIDQLVSPLASLNLNLAFQYFQVFMLTMRREWSGIDRLRLDKFYLLIRRFLSKVFELLKVRGDSGFVKRVMDVVLDNGSSHEDKLLSGGVCYHVVSVFLEELRPFLPVNAEVVDSLLSPFLVVMGSVNDKVLLGKIKSGVFDVLLGMGRKLLEIRKSGQGSKEGDGDDDAVVLGSIALKMGFADKFYQLGSADECVQGNRKVIFGLHREFLKLEKELAASQIEIPMPQENNVNGGDDLGNENSSSAPLDSADGTLKSCNNVKKDSGSDDKKSKKKKKKKKKKNVDSVISSDNSPPTHEENSNKDSENDGSTDHEHIVDGQTVDFNKTMMSNLQVQFEKVAAEAGLPKEVASPCESQDMVNNAAVSKKRKRSKSMDGLRTDNGKSNGQADAEGSVATAKSGEKSLKRVRFSMKSNIVWKPQSPLPPQSLRIPPSVTPRGSALKKGVPPGPVREMPPLAVKKVKKRRVVSLKNGKKIIKSIPAKRMTKPISIST